jgi:hypothetical protein
MDRGRCGPIPCFRAPPCSLNLDQRVIRQLRRAQVDGRPQRAGPLRTLSPIEITWLDEHLDDQMWYLPMHSRNDMAPLDRDDGAVSPKPADSGSGRQAATENARPGRSGGRVNHVGPGRRMGRTVQIKPQ